MKKLDFKIQTGSISDVQNLSLQIPEFETPYSDEKFKKRLLENKSLILIASYNGQQIGFKAGYKRDDYFYSWVGAVLPEYRKMGIAKKLAIYQEKWAKKEGFDQIVFKTRNRFKSMLLFGLTNGFDIIGFEAKDDISNFRIILKKDI